MLAESAATAAGTSDEELAHRAARGDKPAFEALYRRHAGPLYDFVIRTTRDSGAAADIVQESFITMWEALPGLRNKASVRSWLFSVARNRAIDHVRRAPREVAMDGNEADEPAHGAYTLPDPGRDADPALAAIDHETARLVWDAACALSPEDYSLLDLHVRQGFDADELANALGLKKGAVYTRLTRLRQAMADSVAAVVLVRSGRRECPRLDAMLDSLPETISEHERQRLVTQHAAACERCRETRRKLVSPVALFGSFAPVAFPGRLEVATWARIESRLGTKPPQGHSLLTGGHARIGLLSLAGLAVVVMLGWMLTSRPDEPADVANPGDIRSLSHVPAVPSSAEIVVLTWRRPDGADAFAVAWNRERESTPAAVDDLAGDVAEVRSPRLGPGEWYFHLRTRGGDRWTDAVHVGPFVIVDAVANPGPAATPTAVATPSQTPTLAATATSTPSPTATATIVAAATPQPTAVPAATSTSTSTSVSTATSTASATPSATTVPSPTSTNTPVPNTPTALPTATDTPAPSPTSTSTATATPTSTPAPTSTPTSVPTNTPVPPPPTSTPESPPTSTPTSPPEPSPTPTNTPPPPITPSN